MRKHCSICQSTNNNYYKDKSEFEKQIEQTKKDKETRIRQTFYGSNAFQSNHGITSTNFPDPASMSITNYYKPGGYQSGALMRPNTQDGAANRSPAPSGEGLADGNILSNIDGISNDELKERLVVAEMIMKKLYSRNKDLEIAINKFKSK